MTANDRGIVGTTRLAPAKVNLYLHVVGRRTDGYHDLDSLVVFADVGDHVAVEDAETLQLTVDGPFATGVPTDNGNLVLRAAAALAAAAERPPRAHVRLTKSLPVAAGIGGGSADAAATLRCLCALWSLSPPPDKLNRVALSLGADVPVCLQDRAMWVGGLGESLVPAPPLPPVWLVLVNPGVEVLTPTVFKQRSGPFSAPARFAEIANDAEGLADLLADRRNDLTDAAIATAPVIGRVLDTLADLPGALLSRMSGSGATCFAVFSVAALAEAAVDTLKGEHPDWWCAAAPLRAQP